jgi:oligopeptide/dipeptide ABC transporter ATP-binding protein
MVSSCALRIEELRKSFFKRRSLFESDEIQAVKDVSLDIAKGAIYGLVGESGCGKTTTARCVVGLERPSAGRIWFEGDEIGNLSPRAFRRYRYRIQMVFQDPADSLNPRFTVAQTIREPLDLHSNLKRAEKAERLKEMMKVVGLRSEHLTRYPHQLSTGQQQRVGVARAVVCRPRLVILDEPTAALDISVRGKVLEMLLELQERFGMTYMFISHDLGTIQYVCGETAVMYLGFVVEQGATRDVFGNPQHPYTQALISAIPRPVPKWRRKREILKGEVPSPIDFPTGCPFHERCPRVMDVCREVRPELIHREPETRRVACHLYVASDEESRSTDQEPGGATNGEA